MFSLPNQIQIELRQQTPICGNQNNLRYYVIQHYNQFINLPNCFIPRNYC